MSGEDGVRNGEGGVVSYDREGHLAAAAGGGGGGVWSKKRC